MPFAVRCCRDVHVLFSATEAWHDVQLINGWSAGWGLLPCDSIGTFEAVNLGVVPCPCDTSHLSAITTWWLRGDVGWRGRGAWRLWSWCCRCIPNARHLDLWYGSLCAIIVRLIVPRRGWFWIGLAWILHRRSLTYLTCPRFSIRVCWAFSLTVKLLLNLHYFLLALFELGLYSIDLLFLEFERFLCFPSGFFLFFRIVLSCV